jgi:filamentous hemagglutinin family protein
MKQHLAVVALACLGFGAHANPVGPTVVSGSASFSTVAGTLTVTNGAGAIINWQSFSIASGERTIFQQSASSTVLNRVAGGSPSSILGMLDSPGRVFLINPNGIVFGSGAQVSVGALVASSLDIGNADFLAGNYRFAAAGSPGAVELAAGATINAAPAGYVVLLAPSVQVGGVINAPSGVIGLGAGDPLELAFTSGTLTGITAGTTFSGMVDATGTLNAPSLIVTAASASIGGGGGGGVSIGGGSAVPISGSITLSSTDSTVTIETGGSLSISGGSALSSTDSTVTTAGSLTLRTQSATTSRALTSQTSPVTTGGGAVSIAGSRVSTQGAAVTTASTPDTPITLNLQKRELAF